MIQGIWHVSFTVSNMDAAVKWYTEVLGLEFVREQIQENTGWPVKFAASVDETPVPTAKELDVLRELHARTNRAHAAA